MYFLELICPSLLHLARSSTPSLIIVINSTNASGATKVNKNPTLNALMNWERAISRKNILKKNLNWLYNTTGTKFSRLYFWFAILFDGKLRGIVYPLSIEVRVYQILKLRYSRFMAKILRLQSSFLKRWPSNFWLDISKKCLEGHLVGYLLMCSLRIYSNCSILHLSSLPTFPIGSVELREVLEHEIHVISGLVIHVNGGNWGLNWLYLHLSHRFPYHFGHSDDSGHLARALPRRSVALFLPQGLCP